MQFKERKVEPEPNSLGVFLFWGNVYWYYGRMIVVQSLLENNKIVREDKKTKRTETIYLSSDAEYREYTGIKKMLLMDGLESNDKLIKEIIKVNRKFGKYHLLSELIDKSGMNFKCENKREKALVDSMKMMLAEAYNKKEDNK